MCLPSFLACRQISGGDQTALPSFPVYQPALKFAGLPIAERHIKQVGNLYIMAPTSKIIGQSTFYITPCLRIKYTHPYQDLNFLQGNITEDESCKIHALEIVERELAERYGMSECIDSVAVFQEAKRIAFLKGDSDSKSDIYKLDELFHLRVKRSYQHMYYSSK
ncbi:hypothetical protein EDD18DRAFT_1115644 [Armillaria luteobubalina]|uniref:Uncharacterized protein n=1 Tax=Armillaria luteobubalina TaxID=153913 RepID=A0AA39P308_9AGAR|nr:hypothetical protein EDD18DRAFT_1115644 [Armillaria luteobubalina]